MTDTHRYLNNLTPLRGIAALWVAAYHFEISVVGFFYPPNTMLLSKGYLMVDLFFIMSGFIIRHVYGQRFKTQLKTTDLKRFVIARFARIYPLHFFTLLYMVFDVAMSHEWNLVNDPAAIPTHLLLLQSFGLHKLSTWNRLSWSLSAEWAAYMLFPLLALLFGRKKHLAYYLLPPLIIIAYFALLYWLPPAGIGNADRLILHKLDVTYDYGFLRGIAGFSAGMLLYDLYMDEKIRRWLSKDITAAIFTLITLYCMHKGVNDLLVVLSFTGIVLSYATNDGGLHRLLSTKPMQHIGRVSYSIYLIQAIAMSFFTIGLDLLNINRSPQYFATLSFLPIFLYIIAYLTFLTILSTVTYYGIENPCRNYINRTYIPSPV